MKSRYGLFAVLLSSLILFHLPNKALAELPNDFLTSPMVTGLDYCKTSGELDCIESVEVAPSKSAPFSTLNYDSFVPHVFRYTDFNGNVIDVGVANFSGSGYSLPIRVELESPKHRLWQFGSEPWHVGSAMRVFVDLPTTDFTSQVRVKIRTSFLIAQDVMLKAANSTYEKIAIEGGTHWTFTGTQTTISGYNLAPGCFNECFYETYSQITPADWTFPSLNFIVHHYDPAPNSSYFDPTCHVGGLVTMESQNGAASGIPLWDSDSKSININIAAAHLRTDGTLNQGFYSAELPNGFVSCAWGPEALALAQSGDLVVTVTDLVTGQPQQIKYTITNSDNILKLNVTGFHYSLPTVKVFSKTCPNNRTPNKSGKCPASGKDKKANPQSISAYKWPTGWQLHGRN